MRASAIGLASDALGLERSRRPLRSGSIEQARPAASPPRALGDELSFLHRAIGNRDVQRLLASVHGDTPLGRPPAIQGKLAIGRPDDPFEREADRVADAVAGTPSRAASQPAAAAASEGDDEDEGTPIQLARSPRAGDEPRRDALEGAAASLGAGRPLPASERAFFESRLGHDFGGVRIHDGEPAATSARAVGALAYTMGRDVVFDSGRYAPGTTEGRRLLAHELVHVVQQGASRPSAPGPDSPRLRTAPRVAMQAKACRPKLQSFTAKKHTVGAREVGGRCELILGESGVANGISFEAKVDVPEGCTGTLEYVQRVDMCRSIVQNDGTTIHKSSGAKWIDKNDPVDSMQVQSSGSVTFKTDDSPGQPLAGKSVFVRDDFEMWLAWTPDGVGAKRVALGMIEWSWTGKAELVDATAADCGTRWKVTKAKATAGKSVKKTKMPSLGTKIAPGDAPVEPGSCK